MNNGLYVAQFLNSTNPSQINYGAFNITGNNVQPLNHFYWNLLGDQTANSSKAFDYVKAKYNVTLPMFINTLNSSTGTHY